MQETRFRLMSLLFPLWPLKAHGSPSARPTFTCLLVSDLFPSHLHDLNETPACYLILSKIYFSLLSAFGSQPVTALLCHSSSSSSHVFFVLSSLCFRSTVWRSLCPVKVPSSSCSNPTNGATATTSGWDYRKYGNTIKQVRNSNHQVVITCRKLFLRAQMYLNVAVFRHELQKMSRKLRLRRSHDNTQTNKLSRYLLGGFYEYGSAFSTRRSFFSISHFCVCRLLEASTPPPTRSQWIQRGDPLPCSHIGFSRTFCRLYIMI